MIRLVPPTHSALEVLTIRFVGLPFALTSGEGRRTDAGKLRVIRFVGISAFSGVQ